MCQAKIEPKKWNPESERDFWWVNHVLTANVEVNILRVRIREMQGGHSVPEEKIRTRYERALKLIPELTAACDILHIYDNTIEPQRIFKKRKTKYYCWPNKRWDITAITGLTGVSKFEEV